MNTTNNQIAVFIDFENLLLSCQGVLGNDVDVDWKLVLEEAVDYGRMVIRRAYADWSLYKTALRELQGLGVELVQVSSKRGKNAADIRIVIDVMETLLDKNQGISHVLLVSGDSDFTELAMQLRSRSVYVIGLGVSGASAEYLINACDRFIFYDTLIGLGPIPSVQAESDSGALSAFEISEARQLLRRTLQSREGEWVSGGAVKNLMLALNPAFNERNYQFGNFKDFLAAQTDIVRIRTANPGGHLEVQVIPDSQTPPILNAAMPAAVGPEVLLETYLSILEAGKIRMTPNEFRPTIILKFYDIVRGNGGKSLTELKEDLHAFFEENNPSIKWQVVNEAVHQMFHTFCFDFAKDDQPDTSEGARLWDRPVTLHESIRQPTDLLDRCDRGLLQKISRKLGSPDKINREVAARLLYGSLRGQRMLEHVDDLIKQLKEQRL